MSKELQNDEFYLRGGFTDVIIGSSGKTHKINKISSNRKDGSVTITLGQVVGHYLNGIPIIEDIDCEIVTPKQIENDICNNQND